MQQTLERSEGRAGGRPVARAQTGGGARLRRRSPLRIHVVHVCGSAEAAAVWLEEETGAAWAPQAGAARPRVAVDASGCWAVLREVGCLAAFSTSSLSAFFFFIPCAVA